MLCHKCKTNYYSRTHCPKCGAEAFSINKGLRAPVRTSYRNLYIITVAAFLIVIFIALIFLKSNRSAGSNKGDLNSVSLVKIIDTPVTEADTDIPDTVGVINEQMKSSSSKNELLELNLKGVQAYRKGDYNKAFIYFYQAYSINKENETTRKNLYNTLMAKGNVQLSETLFSEALETFTKGFDFVDNDYSAYQGIGLAHFGLGNTDVALDNLLRAYSYNQTSDELKLAIAKIYYTKDDFTSSQKFIDVIADKTKHASDISALTTAARKRFYEVRGKVGASTSHFTVYYDGNKDPVAGRLVSMILDEAYYSVGRALDHYPVDKVTAILYTREQFDENMSFPDWSGAVFDGKIKLPAGGLKDRSNKLQEVLAHEYTHAVIYYKTGNNCPTWLNEGLARILSGRESPGEELIRAIVKKDKLPGLERLHNSFIDMSKEDALTAYTLSMLFTRKIIDKFGMSAVNDYLDRLAEGEDSAAAFNGTFYRSIDSAYKSFIKELKSRYK